MPPSKNLATYDDVHAVLDSALTHGEIRYIVETMGHAHNFRMRINSFRKLLREHMTGTQGIALPRTKFDDLEHSISEGKTIAVVVRRKAAHLHTMTDAAGNPIEAPKRSIDDLLSESPPKDAPQPPETILDFENFAANFARSQGIVPDDE